MLNIKQKTAGYLFRSLSFTAQSLFWGRFSLTTLAAGIKAWSDALIHDTMFHVHFADIFVVCLPVTCGRPLWQESPYSDLTNVCQWNQHKSLLDTSWISNIFSYSFKRQLDKDILTNFVVYSTLHELTLMNMEWQNGFWRSPRWRAA